MSFSIRTLSLATLLVATIVSWNSLSADLWVWTLLVFLATVIFLASLEMDATADRQTILESESKSETIALRD